MVLLCLDHKLNFRSLDQAQQRLWNEVESDCPTRIYATELMPESLQPQLQQ